MSDYIININDRNDNINDNVGDSIELNRYDDCCICLNTLDKKEEDEEYLTLGCCKKMLHKGCLISWMCYGNYTELKCPMCRSYILNITNLVSLKDICDVNMQLNNNTIVMIDNYYRDDRMYEAYVRQRDLNNNLDESANYFRIDKTVIYYFVSWVILFTFSLIFLFVTNFKDDNKN